MRKSVFLLFLIVIILSTVSIGISIYSTQKVNKLASIIKTQKSKSIIISRDALNNINPSQKYLDTKLKAYQKQYNSDFFNLYEIKLSGQDVIFHYSGDLEIMRKILTNLGVNDTEYSNTLINNDVIKQDLNIKNKQNGDPR